MAEYIGKYAPKNLHQSMALVDLEMSGEEICIYIYKPICIYCIFI